MDLAGFLCPRRCSGPRPAKHAAVSGGLPGALGGRVAAGTRRWLLIGRDRHEPSDLAYYLAYYLAYGPERTTALDLVRVAHERWAIEEGFAQAKGEQAKGEVGLDHYEVRTWHAWHRFI